MKFEQSESFSIHPALTLLHPTPTILSPEGTNTPSPYLPYIQDPMERRYEDTDVIRFESIVQAIVPTIFGLIALLGFIGNLLVIIVVLSTSQMRNTTNVLIFNLAVADLVFIIICVPLTAVGYSIPHWPFGDIVCKIYQYVIHVTAYASVYTLVLMSLDRYLAVVHPIHSITIRTQRNVTIAVLIAWVLILIFNYESLINNRKIEYNFTNGELRSGCINSAIYDSSPDMIHDEDDSELSNNANGTLKEGAQNRTSSYVDSHDNVNYEARKFYAVFFTFGYVLPLSLVCILYGLMIRRLLYGTTPGDYSNGRRRLETATISCDGTSASSRCIQGNSESTGPPSVRVSGEKMRAKRRVTRLVIVVVVTFALCWLPIHLVFILQFFTEVPDDKIGWVALKIACNCLAYTNSCVNPLLYAFLSDNFRKSFRRVLGCPVPMTGRSSIPSKGRSHSLKCICCANLRRIGERRSGRGGRDRSGLFHEERLLSRQGKYRETEASRAAVAAAAARSSCRRKPLEPRPATIPIPSELTRFTSLVTDVSMCTATSTARGSLSPGSGNLQSQPNSPDPTLTDGGGLNRFKQRSKKRQLEKQLELEQYMLKDTNLMSNGKQQIIPLSELKNGKESH